MAGLGGTNLRRASAFLCAAWALTIASGAQAGAWMRAPGEVFASARAGYFVSDGDGRRYRKADIDLYAEVGVLERLTVGGQAVIGEIENRTHLGAERRTGTTLLEAFVQSRIFERGQTTVSMRTLASWPTVNDDVNRLALRDDGYDLENRLLIGHSFTALGREAFVDIQSGYRSRFGPAADEVRADATFGVKAHERVLLLMQSLNTIGVGNEDPGGATYDVYKLQPSLVWKARRGVSLQSGALIEVAGRNVPPGTGGFVGVWLEF